MTVSWFTRYKDIKDFIDLITNRLRIFHISSLSIQKVYDQKINKTNYKLTIQMYSYYRLPQVDEFGEVIKEEQESTFN